MENFMGNDSRSTRRLSNTRSANRIGDPSDSPHGDEALGDEAAFPSTWQALDAGESLRD